MSPTVPFVIKADVHALSTWEIKKEAILIIPKRIFKN
jgi:hypothetical protein